MSKTKKSVSLFIALILVLFMVVSVSATVLADLDEDVEGSFDVFILRNGDWQRRGEIGFSDYEIRNFALENDAGQLKLRLFQQGHDGAYVDYVALMKAGTTYLPASAINIDENTSVLTKVLSPEYDVCDAWNSTLEIVWDNVPENTTLVMRAMEEDLGEGHGGPFYYPWIHSGDTLSHTLVNDGGTTVDGLLEESTEPDFSVFWEPITPHPDGYTYGWLHCDEENLYAAVEVTADNTPDEEDWGEIYIIVNGELEEFRISYDDTRWGAIGFQYTSSVPYEHRIYEFEIPLGEIDARIGDELKYGFGAYGTLACRVDLTFGTVPAVTGNILFDGFLYGDGDFIPELACFIYPIEAQVATGYEFSEWQTEGGIFVDNPTASTTTCHVFGSPPSGTLRMVQTPSSPPGVVVGGTLAAENRSEILVPIIGLATVCAFIVWRSTTRFRRRRVTQ